MEKYKKLLNICTVAASSVLCAWGFNKWIFIQARKKDVLHAKNKHQYSWRFGDIFYTKSGEGSPVLLIHDLKSTASAAEWTQLISHLSKDHTVYALDLLGCGRSEKPKMTYTNYIYVQLINNFIKEVIGARTTVITSGFSSTIAIMGCYSEPELYHKIMLVNPPSMKSMVKYPKANHKTLKYLIEMPIIGTSIYNMATSYSSIFNRYKKQVLNLSEDTDHAMDLMYEASHLGGPSARYFYASEKCHYTNINILHALKKLNHSIYLIGGSDQEDIRDIFDSYVVNNPSIETDYVDNCKHYPHIEKTEEFASLCSIYLS